MSLEPAGDTPAAPRPEGPRLQRFAPEVWIAAGDTVPFLTVPFPTRMTVVRLPDGALFVHSPERLDDTLRRELAALGEVRHLVSPNKLHHLFLAEWLAADPEASSHAAPGLPEKRPDLRFDTLLGDRPEPPWAPVMDQLVFRGSRAMEEVVFFHRPTRTLLLTDLVENFEPDSLGPLHRLVARAAGILAPDGKTPVDWRLSFLLGRATARRCLERMLEWAPERVILAHGRCIRHDGTGFLRRSFRWLLPDHPHSRR
ncbi:MAG TPA: DUF4336 domain-containing protein [Gammaproteobacteria bacterium]|nr:DUF4336 domain-containing protein [Gammaproteobacteria bacterium]